MSNFVVFGSFRIKYFLTQSSVKDLCWSYQLSNLNILGSVYTETNFFGVMFVSLVASLAELNTTVNPWWLSVRQEQPLA